MARSWIPYETTDVHVRTRWTSPHSVMLQPLHRFDTLDSRIASSMDRVGVRLLRIAIGLVVGGTVRQRSTRDRLL